MMVEKGLLQKIIDEANDGATSAVRIRDRLLKFKETFYGMDWGRRYQTDFPYFFKDMLEEMNRHYPNKGDSYIHCSVENLEEVLKKAIEDYWKLDWDHPRKASQTVDIANVCAMLNRRLQGL